MTYTTSSINKEFIFDNLVDRSGSINVVFKKRYDVSESAQELYDICYGKHFCTCGKPTGFLNFKKGYRKFCSSSCSNNDKEVKAKKEETCFENNGTSQPLSSKKVRDKRKTTMIELYGHEHPIQNEKIKSRIENTNLERYGDTNLWGGNSSLKPKIKEKWIEKYGADNPAKSTEVKNKMRITNIKDGRWLDKTNLEGFKAYKYRVWEETNKNNLSSLENFDKRGHVIEEGSYHLDHKFSIAEGYKRNILPVYMGSLNNLEMIPAKENIAKFTKCSIDESELFKNNKGIKK